MSASKTEPPEQLHVQHNGTEWWIAATPEAAREAMNIELFMSKGTPEELDGENREWTQLADDKLLHIFEQEDNVSCGDEGHSNCKRQTMADWVRECGPGFLCSTEW